MNVLCLLTNHKDNQSLYNDVQYLDIMFSLQRDKTDVGRLAKLTLAGAPEEYVQTEISMKLQLIAKCCRESSIRDNAKVEFESTRGENKNEDDTTSREDNKPEPEYVVAKAVGTLSKIAKNHKIRDNLNKYALIEETIELLAHKHPSVGSQAAVALHNFLESPNGLNIWLKYDSMSGADCAMNHITRINGQIRLLPQGKGKFTNWGAEIKQNDSIEVKTVPAMENWSIGVWFIHPVPKTGEFHTLI